MNVRSCSNCTATDDLHLVTLGQPGSDTPGRTLLYCPQCRASHRHRVNLSWPHRLVTPGTFLELYRMGKTESDPRVAVGLLFGPGHEWIATEAGDILERRRLDEPHRGQA